ncbi:Protein angel homolog 2 [Durusdinium trenchii]|uniref:Protein angel homolog 2 n=1 Tax=Durusdinium trenchii TaxID=1381693 RepID=A0ABP0SMQ4_9DINO
MTQVAPTRAEAKVPVFARADAGEVRRTLRKERDATVISVLSFNILANVNLWSTSGKDFFSKLDQAALPWEARLPRLLAILLKSEADVIMLQEVEKCAFEQDLVPKLSGYFGLHEERIKKSKTEPPLEIPACAVFFKKDRFELAWRAYPYRTVLCGLRLLDEDSEMNGKILAVANCHLEGHPLKIKERHSQLKSVLSNMDRNDFHFSLLGGDLNDGANSKLCKETFPACSYFSAYQFQEEACDVTCAVRVTPESDRDASRVDHIFFGKEQFNLLAVQSVMDPEWNRTALLNGGLPCALWPSDHFSISAVVELAKPSMSKSELEKETAEELLARSPLTDSELAAWKAYHEQFGGDKAMRRKGKPDALELAALQEEAKRRRDQRAALMDPLSDAKRSFIEAYERKLKTNK